MTVPILGSFTSRNRSSESVSSRRSENRSVRRDIDDANPLRISPWASSRLLGQRRRKRAHRSARVDAGASGSERPLQTLFRFVDYRPLSSGETPDFSSATSTSPRPSMNFTTARSAAVDLPLLGADLAHAEGRALPEILVVTFRDRHVEVVGDLRLDLAEDSTLPLQRMILGDVHDEAKDAHDHGRIRPFASRGAAACMAERPPALRHGARAASSRRATSSISNASITSPGLTSLKFSSPMPHSRPEVTSRTSSLKRRRLADLAFEDRYAVADQPHARGRG